MSAARNRGKSWERTCAKTFGGERVGTTGKADPDVITPTLVIECKRVDEASVRGSWIEQARRASRAHKKPWLVVHARKGSPISTVTMDTRLALYLLRRAHMVPPDTAEEIVQSPPAAPHPLRPDYPERDA